jgi:hypothetical protein
MCKIARAFPNIRSKTIEELFHSMAKLHLNEQSGFY